MTSPQHCLLITSVLFIEQKDCSPKIRRDSNFVPAFAQVRVYDVTGGLFADDGLLYATAHDTFGDNVPWDYVVDYVQGGRNYDIR
jgi:hypothetical protein